MKTQWILAATLALVAPVAGCATDNSEDDAGGPSGPSGSSQGGSDSGGAGGDAAAGGGDEGGGDGSGGMAGASSSSTSTSSTGGGGGEGPTTCGNGMLDEGEQCDGTEFGGKDCASFGLGTGTLICNPYCGVVVSSCKPKESCYDFVDNDTDGLYDCDDVDDCLMASSCQDSCTPAKSANVPAYLYATTNGRPNIHSASCNGGGSGNEIMYELTAPNTGDLAITLYSSFGADFSISVRSECGNATAEIACTNEVTGSDFSSENLSIPVVQGTKYFVMVDGVDTAQKGDFSLYLEMPLPESDPWQCNDLWDNDLDGYMDCDDATTCQQGASCVPGVKTAGEPCFGQNECFSPNNDPICLQDWMGYPGGYCTQFCDVAAPDCAGDSLCKQIGISHNGVCLDGCVTDADCRPGYACSEQGLATKVCTLAPEGGIASQCTDYTDNDNDSLVDCQDPYNCQSTAECVSGPQQTGQVCTVHKQCSANANDPFCISQSQYFWQGGYCSQFCDIGLQDCPAGNLCAASNPFFWIGNGQNAICFKTCASTADCEPGYQCDNYFGSFTQNICHW